MLYAFLKVFFCFYFSFFSFLVIFISTSENFLFRFIGHFQAGLSACLALCFLIFHIVWILMLYGIYNWKRFYFPLCGMHLHSIVWFPHCIGAFSFNEVQFANCWLPVEMEPIQKAHAYIFCSVQSLFLLAISEFGFHIEDFGWSRVDFLCEVIDRSESNFIFLHVVTVFSQHSLQIILSI